MWIASPAICFSRQAKSVDGLLLSGPKAGLQYHTSQLPIYFWRKDAENDLSVTPIGLHDSVLSTRFLLDVPYGDEKPEQSNLERLSMSVPRVAGTKLVETHEPLRIRPRWVPEVEHVTHLVLDGNSRLTAQVKYRKGGNAGNHVTIESCDWLGVGAQ